MGLTPFPLSPVKGGGTGWGAKEKESDKIFVVSVFWEQASRKTKPCALGCRFPLDATRLQHCLGNNGSGTQLPFQVPQRTSPCKTTIHLTAGSRDGSERFLHMDNLDSISISRMMALRQGFRKHTENSQAPRHLQLCNQVVCTYQ